MLSTTLPTVEFTVGENPLGSNNGVSRATKKVRTKTELLPDTDDSTMDGNGQKVQGSEVPRASYKLALLGASPVPAQNALMEQDFALTKGDMITEVVEGVLLITFFDRIQEYIERRMSRTIICENDEDDYTWALVGESLVIFGRYLIIRPWSSDFSMAQNEIESQVVWIRLPGLPKGGRFARLAVYVDLRKSLVSKVKINDRLQRVESQEFNREWRRRPLALGCWWNGGREEVISQEWLGTMEVRKMEQNQGLGSIGDLGFQVTKSQPKEVKVG
ncbi:hypothetical protein GOBAR_AA26090 [Gossypium barbadense]|uniref:Uncharacterized protein n=1 Tax=Gossypium barbadense TaxID=3634 RepID=A0A2P5WU25_GOSBA|nr:hypothetical protein GOBAR_AA26090 [Gossypium barbadense]